VFIQVNSGTNTIVSGNGGQIQLSVFYCETDLEENFVADIGKSTKNYSALFYIKNSKREEGFFPYHNMNCSCYNI